MLPVGSTAYRTLTNRTELHNRVFQLDLAFLTTFLIEM